MGSYVAILNISKTMLKLIWNSIKDDGHINSIISSENEISLSSPKAIENEQSKKLSVFLYKISEFSNMRNQPMPKKYPNQLRPTPLFLELHYIISPFTQNTENDHLILGKIMQVFANSSILRGSLLQGSSSENDSDLRLVLDSLSIDDLNRLWSTIGTNYRISVSYCVAPVIIELPSKKEAQRVLEEKTGYKFASG